MIEVLESLDVKRMYFLMYIANQSVDWVKITMNELRDIIKCSIGTIYNITRELEQKGVLQKEKKEYSDFNHTISYKLVDKEKVLEILKNFPHYKTLEIPKPKTTICQDMVRIWTQVTGQSVVVTQKLARYLVAAMNHKFKVLSRWKDFCIYVVNSKRFKSDKIKSLIHHVLKFKRIDKFLGNSSPEERRIYARYITCKKLVADHLKDLISSKAEDERCIELRKKIINKYGVFAYVCHRLTEVSFIVSQSFYPNKLEMDIEILGKPFDEYMVRTHYGCELKIKRITS